MHQVRHLNRASACRLAHSLSALLVLLLAGGLGSAVLAETTPEPFTEGVPEATPVPRITSTPHPDGSLIHIVQPGDTLSQLARDYGVSLDALRALNSEAIGEDDLIYVGQELVIVAPPRTPTPTLPPTAAPTPSPNPTATQPPQPMATPRPEASLRSPVRVALCVLAYHDRDGNRTWEPEQGEELLPGAVFTLTLGGAARRYTTDGVLEPYCFGELEAGNYVLALEPPSGYRVVSGAPGPLVVEAPITRAFGCQRSQDLAIAPTAAAPAGGLASAPTGHKLLIAAGLLGVLVAIGAVALRLTLAQGGPLL